MADKDQNFHIVMSTSAGELDRVPVLVRDGEDHTVILREALIKMIESTPVEPGDIFTVEQR